MGQAPPLLGTGLRSSAHGMCSRTHRHGWRPRSKTFRQMDRESLPSSSRRAASHRRADFREALRHRFAGLGNRVRAPIPALAHIQVEHQKNGGGFDILLTSEDNLGARTELKADSYRGHHRVERAEADSSLFEARSTENQCQATRLGRSDDFWPSSSLTPSKQAIGNVLGAIAAERSTSCYRLDYSDEPLIASYHPGSQRLYHSAHNCCPWVPLSSEPTNIMACRNLACRAI